MDWGRGFRPFLIYIWQVRLLALLSVILMSLVIWSCNTNSAEDEYTVTFKLDSARVGKFDSVLVEIYNGAAPGPGEAKAPVQKQVIAVSRTAREITIKLDAKVQKDFSVVITGFAGDVIVYRNLHEVDGYTSPDPSKPSVLLITTIKAEDLTVSVGETRAPALSITPENAGDKRVLLVSSDSAKVKIVSDTLVMGLVAGSAKVVASTADRSIKVEFTVNVVAVRVNGFTADSVLALKVGDSVVPAISILPANATEKGFSLESSDSALVEVDGKSIKALKAGKVLLTLISKDGGAKDTITVNVRLAVTGMKGNDLVKQVGDRFVPVLEWTPSDATNQGYTLVSSDPSKVEVSGDSLVSKAIGTATVTATSKDGGFKAGFVITVQARVFKVKGIEAGNLRALAGDTVAATVTFDPANASDKGFTLATADTAVVKLLDDKIAALANGTAEIVVTSVDGGFKDTITFSVETSNFKDDIKPITASKCAACHVPPSRLDWTDSAVFIRHGATAIARLKLPASDSLHMPLPGAVGGPITERELKVLLAWLARTVVPLQSGSIADTTVNLGDTVVPDIKFVPANASNKFYTLTLPDTSVAMVVGGALVPVATGKVNVTATLEDGNRKVVFSMTVKAPLFQTNVLPIVSIKCAPCHLKGSNFNWQDSVALMADGSEAIRRINLAVGAPGHMPQSTDGNPAPNGELTAQQLRVLLGWLHSKVVPLIGITAPNDSVFLGTSKAPNIVYNPANASNKTYELISTDSSKITVEDGKLFGLALGSALVQVKALDGGFVKFFTVKVVPVAVDSIAAHDTAGAIGDTVFPAVDFFPSASTNKGFTIALLKASTKVKIDSAKKIIGLALGKDTLEATSADGSKKSKFTFTVGPVLPKSMVIADTDGVVSGSQVKPRITWVPTTTTDKRFKLQVTVGDTTLVAAVRTDSFMLPRTAVGQVTVKATSVADPSIFDSFTFTVGTVAVSSIAVTNTPVKVAIGFTVAPGLTFTPTNATNKGYSLAVPVGDASNLITAGGGLLIQGVHLDTSVVVVSSTDGAKKANWNVQVIRTPMGNSKTLIFNRCSGCHYPASIYGNIPAWCTTVTNAGGHADSGLIVIDSNSTKIIKRISTLKDMPPGGALPQAEIDTIVNWLNKK
ncbi:MAG: Ig domain protein group 2 domain protein [Fibrobacteres bacterium]|nr:Ig domain protein group 2 domain protein [Fibrobacterota bacterium]